MLLICKQKFLQNLEKIEVKTICLTFISMFLIPPSPTSWEEMQPLCSVAHRVPLRAGCYLEMGIFDSDYRLPPFIFPEMNARQHLQLCRSFVNVKNMPLRSLWSCYVIALGYQDMFFTGWIPRQ